MIMMTPPVEIEVRMRKKKMSECDATPFLAFDAKGGVIRKLKSCWIQGEMQRRPLKIILDLFDISRFGPFLNSVWTWTWVLSLLNNGCNSLSSLNCVSVMLRRML